MQRRQFITIAAAGAAGLAWPPAAAPTAAHALACPSLLTVLGDAAAVRGLGIRYLELVPAERDERLLVRAILPGPHASFGPEVVTQVASLITQDFSVGRTVTVHGWILSVTEARQCALYALQST